MRKLLLLLFFSIAFAFSVNAQYTQLMENRGEIGVFQGMSSYKGDIAPGVVTFNPTYGGFYKKLVNDYIGIRFNYEKIQLVGNDNYSSNMYVFLRSLSFDRQSHDASVMLELYFLRFIDGNKHYRFSPYLSFGVGALKTISGKLFDNINNIPVSNVKSNMIISYPINFGLKYNLMGRFNVFGEATYRFTNSDHIDYFGDVDVFPRYGGQSFQASTSGNDQYFSFKAGLSYNLLKIYGPDKKLNEKKKSVFSGDQNVSKTSSKKGLFSLFKH